MSDSDEVVTVVVDAISYLLSAVAIGAIGAANPGPRTSDDPASGWESCWTGGGTSSAIPDCG
ncbi:hypothetical protein ABZ511_26800 [Nocardia gamkensis]|uniref:hypothetical protein n=1 Tax=Nocardia gamkensis TaxID=352869 RepID=UPI0033E6D9B4